MKSLVFSNYQQYMRTKTLLSILRVLYPYRVSVIVILSIILILDFVNQKWQFIKQQNRKHKTKP